MEGASASKRRDVGFPVPEPTSPEGKTGPRLGLLDLPSDLLKQVLGKASESGRLTYALACRQWRDLAPELQRAAALEHMRPCAVVRELAVFRHLTSITQTGDAFGDVKLHHLMLLTAIPNLQRISFDYPVVVANPKPDPFQDGDPFRSDEDESEDDDREEELSEAEQALVDMFKTFLMSFPALVSLSLPNLEGYYELPDNLHELPNLEELHLCLWPEDAEFPNDEPPLKGVMALPPSLGRCPKLKKLSLGGYLIDSMEHLCGLPAIEFLALDFPMMGDLEPGIGGLRTLKELYLKAPVDSLPEEVLNLTRLTALVVASDELESLPEGLGEQMRRLQRLILEAPRLRKLPQSLWSLDKLDTLTAGVGLASLFRAAEKAEAAAEAAANADAGASRVKGKGKEKAGEQQAEGQAREGQVQLQCGKGAYRGPWHRLRTLEIVDYEASSMPDGSHRLRNLTTLRITDCRNLRFMIPLDNLTRLEELSFFEVPSLRGLPAGILGLKTLKELSIQHFRDPYDEGLRGPMGDWSGLSSLTSLTLRAFDGLKELPASLSQLQALTEVHLAELPELVLSPELFRIPNLRVLVLDGLSAVKGLPQGVDWAAVENLEELRLQEMQALEELPAEMARLPKLKELMIVRCPQLQALPDSLPGSLQNLRLCNAGMLRALPERLGDLQQLHHVSVVNCSEFLRLPDSIILLQGLKNLVLSLLPSLDQDVKPLLQLSSLEDLFLFHLRKGKAMAAEVLLRKAQLPHLNISCLQRLTRGHPGLPHAPPKPAS